MSLPILQSRFRELLGRDVTIAVDIAGMVASCDKGARLTIVQVTAVTSLQFVGGFVNLEDDEF